MSYLNPITLTPKLYQSTDPQAPQLTGQASDIKSIFKACLATGYGDKIGAGFTLDNETDTVCEFISPNIAMSKIGVDSRIGGSQLYYYHKNNKIQQVTINTRSNSQVKDMQWTMLACELGLYFVIHGNNRYINGWQNSLVYYIGCIKSAINDSNQNMIAFEHGGASTSQIMMYRSAHIGTYTSYEPLSNVCELAKHNNRDFYLTMTSDVFWRNNGVLLGLQPGLLHQVGTNLPKNHSKTTYDGKDVLYYHQSLSNRDYEMRQRSYGVMIQTENWEY